MKIGDIVTFVGASDADEYNYTREHPAIVTRVNSDTMVNLKVFFDCGPVEDRSSVAAQHAPHRSPQQSYFKPHGV